MGQGLVKLVKEELNRALELKISKEIHMSSSFEERWARRLPIEREDKGYLAMLLEVKICVFEYTDQITDFWLLYTIYGISLKEDLRRIQAGEATQFSYKIFSIIVFMSIAAQYLIQYSGMINSYWQRGIYEPERFQNLNVFNKFGKILFLMAVGPLLFVIVEIINFIKAMMQIPCLLISFLTGDKSKFWKIERCFDKFYENTFNMSGQLKNGRQIQKSITILFF